MEYVLITLLNGLSYGLLLFMLSAGLTLIFSMMGVLNFAHASFYMFGAYIAYAISTQIGFWPALILAPLGVALIGALVERFGLRTVHKYGHISELLFTFGLFFVAVEGVQLIWGRGAVDFPVPAQLDGPLFTLFSTNFPIYKGFEMLIALLMLLSIYLVLTRTRIGLVIQAALTHPDMVGALGHNVPRVFTLVFGFGCFLAGLAGVVGGNAGAGVTDPNMARTMGPIIFVVVVVGGMGSLPGAFLASLLIGVLVTFAVAMDYSMMSVLSKFGVEVTEATFGYSVLSLTISKLAQILPYLLMVLILIFRPKGLMGKREG